jgi:hypothetical protein
MNIPSHTAALAFPPHARCVRCLACHFAKISNPTRRPATAALPTTPLSAALPLPYASPLLSPPSAVLPSAARDGNGSGLDRVERKPDPQQNQIGCKIKLTPRPTDDFLNLNPNPMGFGWPSGLYMGKHFTLFSTMILLQWTISSLQN